MTDHVRRPSGPGAPVRGTGAGCPGHGAGTGPRPGRRRAPTALALLVLGGCASAGGGAAPSAPAYGTVGPAATVGAAAGAPIPSSESAAIAAVAPPDRAGQDETDAPAGPDLLGFVAARVVDNPALQLTGGGGSAAPGQEVVEQATTRKPAQEAQGSQGLEEAGTVRIRIRIPAPRPPGGAR